MWRYLLDLDTDQPFWRLEKARPGMVKWTWNGSPSFPCPLPTGQPAGPPSCGCFCFSLSFPGRFARAADDPTPGPLLKLVSVGLLVEPALQAIAVDSPGFADSHCRETPLMTKLQNAAITSPHESGCFFNSHDCWKIAPVVHVFTSRRKK